MSALPRKQTFVSALSMSALCQERVSAWRSVRLRFKLLPIDVRLHVGRIKRAKFEEPLAVRLLAPTFARDRTASSGTTTDAAIEQDFGNTT